jgi:hypothetical protein
MPLESKIRQKFTRIAAMRIVFTRIGCTLLTCDMYMSDLRHIHDPVLSSLKMEDIRYYFILLSIIIFFSSYQPYTSLHFALPNYNLLLFPSLLFTFYFLSPSLPLTGLHFPNPRFENIADKHKIKFAIM